MTQETRERLLRLAPYLVVSAACLALSGKPFHIDDANFLHFAADVLANPLRPFLAGAIHSNPPGHQYLLALLLLTLGDSERALHLGLLPFALLAVWGSQRLAERFAARPTWLPALLAACSPCFLLSAASLMPDVVMLGLLLPAMALLFDDEERPHPLRLGGAALLFAISWTLRFNGLPPLVLAALLSLFRGHRRALSPLLALIAAFALWTWISAVQLGAPQTLSPVAVSGSLGTGGGLLVRRLLSAACALVLVTALGPAKLLLQPERGARRALELLGAAAIAGVTVWPVVWLASAGALLLAAAWLHLPAAGAPASPRGAAPASPRDAARAGAGDASPAAARAARQLFGLDADVLFLVLWAASGLAVPVLYNQSAAKYFNLPLLPLLLLLLRAAAGSNQDVRADSERERRGLAAAAVCLVIAGPLLVADFREATARRDLIVEQVAKAKASGAGTVWAAGTPWGMLAYSVRSGARFASSALEPGSVEARALAPGDQVIDLSWPGSLALPAGDVALLEERTLEDGYPLRLMSGGAGYWSSVWGIAPFVFSTEPYQRCWRVRVLNKIRER